MNRIIAYFLICFAVTLYLISAVTFMDYLVSLTIPDTVTAVENAFGRLVILVFMLVMAKFSLAEGKNRLKTGAGNTPPENDSPEADMSNSPEANSGTSGRLEPDQKEVKKGADN